MRITKPLFLLASLSLLTACGPNNPSSSSFSEESVNVDWTSPSTVLSSLSKAKNYTVDFEMYVLGSSGSLYDSHSVTFTSRSYSYVSRSYEFGYAQGANGVFSYAIEGSGVLPGEVLKDDNGAKITSLWDADLFGSFAAFGNVTPDNEDEFVIADKKARLALLDIAGLSRDNYPSMSNVSASIVDGSLYVSAYLSSGDKNYSLGYTVHSINTSYSSLIEEYLDEGGDAFVPEEGLDKIRNLFSTNNYTHHYLNENSAVIGYERFNPDYYIFSCGAEMMSMGYFPGGMVGLDHVKDPETGITFNGCYSLTPSSSNNGENVTSFSVMTSFPYNSSTSDVAVAYNYPSFLELWNNLQYVQTYEKTFPHEGMEEAYIIYDSYVASDFASNFGYSAWLSENGYTASGILIEAKNLDVEPVVYLNLLLNTGDYIEFEFSDFETTYVPVVDAWLATLVEA